MSWNQPRPSLQRSRSRTPPPPRAASPDTSTSVSDSDSTVLGRRAGWRLDLGPLSNPILRAHLSLSEGMDLFRSDPRLRNMALESGLLMMTEIWCPLCRANHVRYPLTRRGHFFWGLYRQELRQQRLQPQN